MRFKFEARLSTNQKLEYQILPNIDDAIRKRLFGNDVYSDNISKTHRHEHSLEVSRKRKLTGQMATLDSKTINSDSFHFNKTSDLKTDFNSNCDHPENKRCSQDRNPGSSAFRKVEKSQAFKTSTGSNINIHTSPSSSTQERHSPIEYTNTSQNNLEISRLVQKSFVPPTTYKSQINSTSLFNTNARQVPIALSPQIRASMIEAYRFSLPQQFSQPSNPALRNLPVMNIGPSKPFGFIDKVNPGMPYMKSSNPMVGGKMLIQTSPLVSVPTDTALQNWCAKCNATFRMTSDLVYHMRSHHKREFDPAKKKRDDKLQCNICQETFRERHHLTRHMTSHT